MTRALVVIIDPQKDFTSRESSYARKHSGIDQITAAKERINNLVRELSGEKLVVVCSDYAENQFGEDLSLCIPGTEGHKIDIRTGSNCILMTKKRHSCFSSAAFIRYLLDYQIGKLLLCGFLAEYCVRQTAIDALQMGLEVWLLEDCIGTGDDVQYRKAQMIAELEAAGAKVIRNVC